MYYKVLFMQETRPAADSLQDIKDIRRIMERSSRFISLSGLSGIAAGICALAGAFIAYSLIGSADLSQVKSVGDDVVRSGHLPAGAWADITWKLCGLALVVFIAAFASSFYLTWRKARQQGVPVWDYTSRRLAWNMLVPLIAGGIFVLGLIWYSAWVFVAPACLVFYGLALVNASKYTLDDIRYLGYCEIVLGLINIFFPGSGLWFWAAGFGLLHIIYGIMMWNKYDRTAG